MIDSLPEGYHWRHFICVDCPEDKSFQVIYPMEVNAIREASSDIDFCPWCGSHLGIIGHGAVVTVTEVPRKAT